MRLADVARIEVSDASFELASESVEASHLRECIGELASVDRSNVFHGGGRALDALQVADDGLYVSETEAHLLELVDPLDSHSGLLRIEAEAALRSSSRSQKSEFFVQVKSPHRLAGLAREIAHS
jgi:hypothetical protein